MIFLHEAAVIVEYSDEHCDTMSMTEIDGDRYTFCMEFNTVVMDCDTIVFSDDDIKVVLSKTEELSEIVKAHMKEDVHRYILVAEGKTRDDCKVVEMFSISEIVW